MLHIRIQNEYSHPEKEMLCFKAQKIFVKIYIQTLFGKRILPSICWNCFPLTKRKMAKVLTLVEGRQVKVSDRKKKGL